MANIHAGYRGIIDLGAASYLRFTDANISAKQGVEIPDVVMGDYDHDVYAYGKIEINGSMSGLIDEEFDTTIWAWGWDRDSCGLLSPKSPSIYYYCDSTGRNQDLTDVYVNSLTLSCAAGEIANWSVDVIGKTASAFGTTSAPAFTTTAKLITWDKVSLTVTDGGDTDSPSIVAFQNFEVTVANNVEAVYAMRASGLGNLFPYDVIPGIRTITGSVTVFDVDTGPAGHDTWDNYTTGNQCTLAMDIGGIVTQSFKVRFHRIEPTMNTGVITSTVAFSGVSHQ